MRQMRYWGDCGDGVNPGMTTDEQLSQREAERLADQLYEQHGKPLEAEHTGAYVAISPRGETILGATLLEVAQEAKARFGTGNFLFKVGERAVGRLR